MIRLRAAWAAVLHHIGGFGVLCALIVMVFTAGVIHASWPIDQRGWVIWILWFFSYNIVRDARKKDIRRVAVKRLCEKIISTGTLTSEEAKAFLKAIQ